MKRLNLNDLKVQSFITSVEEESVNTIKGGRESGFQILCDSTPENCQEPTARCGSNACGTNACGTYPATCRPSGYQFICDTTINCF